MTRLPTYLDRYPAKMVSRLAARLVEQYAHDAQHVFDPFCGSAAILAAASQRGIRTSGVDLNPIAGLFLQTKVRGFDAPSVLALGEEWVECAKTTRRRASVAWPAKNYWFSSQTLDKLERLRGAWNDVKDHAESEVAALLLSFALSIRLCSRADQRSPKPFISKRALSERGGRHFDPFQIVQEVLVNLAELYPTRSSAPKMTFVCGDIVGPDFGRSGVSGYSHVITSPPYINAQDYFRNFKLELYLLEGMLPFRVDDVRERFIGTERGRLLAQVPEAARERHHDICTELRTLERRDLRLAAVVHRYLFDMERAFANTRQGLQRGGTIVLVCGDNLLAGLRIPTWKLLDVILRSEGFVLKDRFEDVIGDRLLPPKRLGHKGLIKKEVVSAYGLS